MLADGLPIATLAGALILLTSMLSAELGLSVAVIEILLGSDTCRSHSTHHVALRSRRRSRLDRARHKRHTRSEEYGQLKNEKRSVFRVVSADFVVLGAGL